LWRNQQTEAHLVLRSKPRNRHGNFEAKIIKPELSVLRPKTIATSFVATLEKTIATSFEAKPAKTVAAGFEAKPLKIVTTGFEAKPIKTVRVVLRPNHSQTIDLGFKSQPRNPHS
jgi:hypothetical protein